MVTPPTRLPEPAAIGGLSAGEARRLAQSGQANLPPKQANRSAGRVIADNCLTPFNFVNVALAVLLVAFGAWRQILFLGVAFFSTAMCVFQELRAKRTLDKLSIIGNATARVIRDGNLKEIAPADVVLGDMVVLGAGDQAIVDGVCTHVLGLEMNEALVTGEADEVVKQAGDTVMSGSYVTAGAAYVRATAVGGNCFAAKLSVEARREKAGNSKIMQMLGRVVAVLAFSIVPVGALLFFSQLWGGEPAGDAAVGTAGALVGMIPQGLVLLTNIAFAVGVVNLGRRRVMVQSLPCIEALARVDTLCLDKTGTITSGALTVSGIVPAEGVTEGEMRRAMAALLGALPGDNRTAEALRREFLREPGPGPETEEALEVIPFSSSRKYSGVRFPNRSLFVGAAEYVLPRDRTLVARAKELSRGGRRALLLAAGTGTGTDTDTGTDAGASATRGMGFVLLEDIVRDNARETFGYFNRQGISIKVISGDDPVTVSGVAGQAGLPHAEEILDLSTFLPGAGGQAETPPPRLRPEDTDKTIFGRTSPHQKRDLIRLMKANGRTVAMTGDGVNDVLAIKEADCGVAMADGSAAVRRAADLVLLSSDFSQMIPAALEGRRVVNNIEKVAALYLSKTIFSALLAVIFIFLPGKYPLTPLQLTLIGALTIGAPSFVLTLKPNYEQLRGDLIRRVVAGAVPNALAVVVCLLAAYVGEAVGILDAADTSTVCTFVTGALGLGLLYRVSRPLDAIRALLLGGMAAAFLGAFALVPSFFGLTNLWGTAGLIAASLAAVGSVCVWLLGGLIHFEKKPKN
ncbi:MAG: HAD-IC family P-type ATPase [Oscillospiraceae bacterium]|nr:HAD-IC family P-type ATPase [Oscillospiraceae bacterium]